MQGVIFAVLFVLLFSSDRDSQKVSAILIVANLFYLSFVMDADAVTYYSYSAFVNLVVGVLLQKINKLAAICSYSLVLVNVGCFFLMWNYLEGDVYDNISLLILLLQLITITPARIKDGIRNHIVDLKRRVVKSRFFNSFWSCVTMYKIHSKN